jgi:hypothetical protein
MRILRRNSALGSLPEDSGGEAWPPDLQQPHPPSDNIWPEKLERRSRPRPPRHFRRLELKYILPERYLEHILDWITPHTEVDPYLVKEGRGRTAYPVTSLYFDSYDLFCLNEKEAGRRFRRKIRLRSYEKEFAETVPCFMEIKRRLDFVVLKDRIALPRGLLTSEVPIARMLDYLLRNAIERDETWTEAVMMNSWLNLEPTAIVRYQRYAFADSTDPSTRLTIDLDIEGSFRPSYLVGTVPLRSIDNLMATGITGISGRFGILELKCNHMIPWWFHAMVMDLELMRDAFSKYFLVVLGLRPQIYEDCDDHFQETEWIG